MNVWRLALLVAGLMLLTVDASAQPRRYRFVSASAGSADTGIIVWNCGTGGSAYPLCTADSNVGSFQGTFWDRSYAGTIGPQSQKAVNIFHIGTTDTAQEYYHGGWSWAVPSVSQGQCAFFRTIIRFNATIAWNDDAGGRFGFKWIAWGTDGTDDTSRFFANLRSDLSVPADTHEGNQVLLRAEKNVDGPTSRTDVHDLTSGVWYFIQIEACTSSTAVATDGTVKIWVNNNTYASPTAQDSGGFAWPALGLNQVRLGMYGESLGVAGNANYDIAGFVYDSGSAGSKFNSSFYVP